MVCAFVQWASGVQDGSHMLMLVLLDEVIGLVGNDQVPGSSRQ